MVQQIIKYYVLISIEEPEDFSWIANTVYDSRIMMCCKFSKKIDYESIIVYDLEWISKFLEINLTKIYGHIQIASKPYKCSIILIKASISWLYAIVYNLKFAGMFE